MKPETMRWAVIGGCIVVLTVALALGYATARRGFTRQALTPTPLGAELAKYNGVCGMDSTSGVEVPAGAVIQWSEQPTSSNNKFDLSALYNSGEQQTVANTPLGASSGESGSVVVLHADTVSFLVNGWGRRWSVTVYGGTQGGPVASTTAASTSHSPSQPPAAPPLADSYVLVESNVVVYLDLRNGIVAVTAVQQSGNGQPSQCLVAHSEEDMTYVQSGVTINIRATYIAPTPFTINPDGSIQHEVPQSDGTVAIQRYMPGSNADYNAAVQRLAAQYPSC